MDLKIAKYLRWGMLTAILLFVTVIAYLHVEVGPAIPNVHALCPFGGLESLYSYVSSGSLLPKIQLATMGLSLVTFVLIILFRRAFCGMICPLGALQEGFTWIGKKIFGKTYVVPKKIDQPLRYLKYLVLFITVWMAWQTKGLWVSPFDPWVVYAHLREGFINIWQEFPIGVIILALTLIGSMLYDRFFCKYLCPMGAFAALFGLISPTKIARDTATCIDCGKCSRVCPVNIDVAHEKNVTNPECIDCHLCVNACPKKGALQVKFLGKPITTLVSLILVLVVFFGGVTLVRLSEWSKAVEKKGERTEQRQEGGESNVSKTAVEEIKGSMTIAQGAEALKIPLDQFYTLFEIPTTVSKDTKLKEVSSHVKGYDFHKIKEKAGTE